MLLLARGTRGLSLQGHGPSGYPSRFTRTVGSMLHTKDTTDLKLNVEVQVAEPRLARLILERCERRSVVEPRLILERCEVQSLSDRDPRAPEQRS